MRGGGSGGSSGTGNGARRGRKTAAIGKPISKRNGNKNTWPFETAYTAAATINISPAAATIRTAVLVAFTDQPLKFGKTFAICASAQSMSSSDAAYEKRK